MNKKLLLIAAICGSLVTTSGVFGMKGRGSEGNTHNELAQDITNRLNKFFEDLVTKNKLNQYHIFEIQNVLDDISILQSLPGHSERFDGLRRSLKGRLNLLKDNYVSLICRLNALISLFEHKVEQLQAHELKAFVEQIKDLENKLEGSLPANYRRQKKLKIDGYELDVDKLKKTIQLAEDLAEQKGNEETGGSIKWDKAFLGQIVPRLPYKNNHYIAQLKTIDQFPEKEGEEGRYEKALKKFFTVRKKKLNISAGLTCPALSVWTISLGMNAFKQQDPKYIKFLQQNTCAARCVGEMIWEGINTTSSDLDDISKALGQTHKLNYYKGKKGIDASIFPDEHNTTVLNGVGMLSPDLSVNQIHPKELESIEHLRLRMRAAKNGFIHGIIMFTGDQIACGANMGSGCGWDDAIGSTYKHWFGIVCVKIKNNFLWVPMDTSGEANHLRGLNLKRIQYMIDLLLEGRSDIDYQAEYEQVQRRYKALLDKQTTDKTKSHTSSSCFGRSQSNVKTRPKTSRNENNRSRRPQSNVKTRSEISKRPPARRMKNRFRKKISLVGGTRLNNTKQKKMMVLVDEVKTLRSNVGKIEGEAKKLRNAIEEEKRKQGANVQKIEKMEEMLGNLDAYIKKTNKLIDERLKKVQRIKQTV